MSLKLGKLPPTPAKPRVRLSAHLVRETLPAAPQRVDYLTRVGDSLGMYLNDQIGDCTIAQAAHDRMSKSTYALGVTQRVSEADVLRAYSAVSGYNPRTGENDNGAVLQDVLNYWRKTGIGGQKILAFAEVDVSNLDEVRAAMSVFGGVTIGMNFPAFAMDQFDAGQPWDVQTRNAQLEGGHAVDGGGYATDTGRFTVVTWGRRQELTEAFWRKYVDEAWVVVSPEWLSAQGTTPGGVDLYGLGEEIARLTGGSNPFPDIPAPQPAPAPAPGPQPAPAPPVAETQFMSDWLAGRPVFYKKFQQQLRDWLRS